MNPEQQAAVNRARARRLPGPQRGVFRRVDDIVRSIASGVTGSYMDEIAGAGDTAVGWHGKAAMGESPLSGEQPPSYAENVTKQRARDQDIPLGIRLPGEIAGSVLSTVATGGLSQGTRIANAFSRLPAWMKTTGLGTFWGGLFGGGSSDPDPEGSFMSGVTDRAVGTGIGAALGAGTAGLIHGVGVYAPRGWQKAKSLWKGRSDPEAEMQRIMGNAFRADQVSAPRAEARAHELGPQAAVLDTGGENVLELARRTAGPVGPARNRIIGMVETRADGASDRITGIVTKHLGPGDFEGAEQAFIANLRKGGDEVYTAAKEAHPVIAMTPRLQAILQTKQGKKALKEASDIAALERAGGEVKWLGPVDQELTQAARYAREVGLMDPVARPGVAKGLSLETWDYIKRGFDALGQKKAYQNELTGAPTHMGRVLQGAARAINKELDRLTGGAEKSLYAKARRQYGGDAEVLQALRDGKNFLNLSPEANAAKLDALSNAGRVAYRNAASRTLVNMVERVGDNSAAVNRIFGNKAIRRQIASIFPSRKAYTDAARRLVAEQKFDQSYRGVGRGSTAPLEEDPSGGIRKRLGHLGAVLGSKAPFGSSLVQAGIGRQAARGLVPTGTPPEVYDALSKALASRDPVVRNQALLWLRANPPTRGQPKHPLIRGLAIGAGELSGRGSGEATSAVRGLIE